MKRQTLVLLLALGGAMATAAAAPYSAQTRQQYLEVCTQTVRDNMPQMNGARYCACTLGQIENEMGEAEFIEAGSRMEQSPRAAAVQKFNQTADKAVQACVPLLGVQ